MPLDCRRLTRITAALALGAGAGCQGLGKARDSAHQTLRGLITSSYNDPDAQAKMADAERLFEAKDYRAARPIFGDLADNTHNPTTLAEKARYLEAECRRELGQLPDAAATYHRLLQDFPYGAYRERSCAQMYAIAYTWLEAGTLKEIEQAQNNTLQPWYLQPPTFVNFTDKSRPWIDTEGEALRVLDNVQLNDGVGPNADRALFWLGYVHFYRGHYDEADLFLSQLIDQHKDSKLRPLALDLAIVAKNNATGGPDYDSTKASEALALIHHAQATVPGYATDPAKSAEMSNRKAEVRHQLAMKYIEQAKYYERTSHPQSAYFYYDLVARQHPGTRPAEFAKERMAALEVLKKQAEADRTAGKPALSPLGRARKQVEGFFGFEEPEVMTTADLTRHPQADGPYAPGMGPDAAPASPAPSTPPR